MCGKEIYHSKTTAKQRAYGISGRTKESTHVYFCDECNGYHLARRQKETLGKTKKYEGRKR